MPWIDVSEPYAKPPRPPARAPEGQSVEEIDINESWAELVGVVAEGIELDLSACSTLEIRSCRLVGVRFEGAEGVVGFINPVSKPFCGTCNRD